MCAGYKVGKVEQSETALGAEMRLAKNKSGKTNAAKDKIVQRLDYLVAFIAIPSRFCFQRIEQSLDEWHIVRP